jgi:hypothetical protein
MKKLLFLLVAMAFPCGAQTWGTLPVDAVISMNTSTPGTSLTTTILGAGTVKSTAGNALSFSSVGTGFTVGANQGGCSNLGAVEINGGTTYAAHTLNYNNIAHNDADNNQNVVMAVSGSIHEPSAVGCFVIGFPDISTDGDDWDLLIFFDGNGKYAVVQINDNGGSPLLRLETSCITCAPCSNGTGHSSNIPLGLLSGGGTTFYYSLHDDETAGEAYLYAYTAQGNPIGNVSWCRQSGSSLGQIYLGNNENGNHTSTSYFQNVAFDFTNGANPLFWTNSAPNAGIIAPSRAIAWNPGVVGGIPDASWTQCTTSACNTVTAGPASSITAAQINSAISSASGLSEYVLLPAGTYTLSGSIDFQGVNNVVLRGASTNTASTYLTFTGTGSGCFGATWSIGICSNDDNYHGGMSNGPEAISGADLTQGSTTITLAAVPNLKVGNPIIIDQLDSTSDVGGIMVSQNTTTVPFTSPGSAGPHSTGGNVGNAAPCPSTTSDANCYEQAQVVTVTQCDGITTTGHSCWSGSNITISPGLYMPNWSASDSMRAWWATTPVYDVGVENLTVDDTSAGTSVVGVEIFNGCNNWVTGVRFIETARSVLQSQYSCHNTFRNNYAFLTQNSTSASYGFEAFEDSDDLVEQNVWHAITTPMIANSAGSGDVFDYNYCINSFYTGSVQYSIPARGDHAGTPNMMLSEGNICNGFTGDAIHSTANMNTYFRNLFTGPSPAVWASSSSTSTPLLTFTSATYGTCSNNCTPAQIYSYHRGYNLVGNLLGSGLASPVYSSTSSTLHAVYYVGQGNGSVPADSTVAATLLRWNNCDSANGFNNCQQNSSEVPSALTGTEYVFVSPVPANGTIPSSFFYSSKPSWWPSAKPWPIIGPDVTGGNLLSCTSGAYNGALVVNSSQCSGGSSSTAVNGLAYSNPAMDCFLNVMGGNPYGTNAVLTFNPAACYAPSAPVAPPSGQSLIAMEHR